MDETDLRPRLGVLAAGFSVVAPVLFASLAWPQALALTLLGTLMIAGADVDARTFLLPDNRFLRSPLSDDQTSVRTNSLQ